MKNIFAEFIRSSGQFDEVFYRKNYPVSQFVDPDPIVDYILRGSALGHCPNCHFNPAEYLRANPDLDLKKLEPFYHWLNYGRAEGRKINCG